MGSPAIRRLNVLDPMRCLLTPRTRHPAQVPCADVTILIARRDHDDARKVCLGKRRGRQLRRQRCLVVVTTSTDVPTQRRDGRFEALEHTDHLAGRGVDEPDIARAGGYQSGQRVANTKHPCARAGRWHHQPRSRDGLQGRRRRHREVVGMLEGGSDQLSGR